LRARTFAVLAGLVLVAGIPAARAQELEPRAYSPSPVGTNFVAVAVGASSGDVLFDPSVPITDASASIGLATVGYGRTFGLWGRQGLVTIGIPYAWGTVEGKVYEEAQEVRRSGLADVRIRTSLNLVGSKAMSVEEFRKAPRSTIVGVSLTVQFPTGEYDRTKLINLGTDRFAVKPEVGVSVPVGRWSLDAYAGAWFFQDADEFYPGNATRSQDPLFSVQGHASLTFRNGAWLAFDATWYGGGETTVDSGPPSTRQSNSRLGATFSFPLTRAQSLKFAASTGASARTGNDFDTALLGWQVRWFDRPRPGA